jgi:HEAT repeat protein
MIPGILQKAGLVTGISVAIGTLAFLTGYLAERAQHAVGHVPFVFIDYWAYAESGLLGLVDTIYLLLSPPDIVLALVVLSLAVVWVMESRWLYARLMQPRWLVVAWLVFLGALLVLIRQQLAVHAMCARATSEVVEAPSHDEHVSSDADSEPDGEAGTRSPARAIEASFGTSKGASRVDSPPSQPPIAATDALPLLAPFSLFVHGPATPPPGQAADVLPFVDRLQDRAPTGSYPDPAVEAWERIADELENDDSGSRIQVRPRPGWVTPAVNAPTSAVALPILGLRVPPDAMDAQRAMRLFKLEIRWLAILIWTLVVLLIWTRAVQTHATSLANAASMLEGERSDEAERAPRLAGPVVAAVGGYQRLVQRLRTSAHPGKRAAAVALHAPTVLLSATRRAGTWLTRLFDPPRMRTACAYVLQPLSVTLLAVSVICLGPENLGALARPALGQEYVEVTTRAQRPSSAPPSGAAAEPAGSSFWSFLGPTTKDEPTDPREPELAEPEFLRQLSAIADAYVATEGGQRDKYEKTWTEAVAKLEHEARPRSERRLRGAVAMTRFLAPNLSAIAHEAWLRVAAETGASRPAFILHYPRSETGVLRTIEPSPVPRRYRWSILPIESRNVAEVRALRDRQTIETVGHLRRMRSSMTEQRQKALVDIQLLGHPNVLEIMLAGLLDPHPDVRGPLVTSVGLYASALDDSIGGRLRRARAERLLWHVAENTSELPSIRTAALTSVTKLGGGRNERAASGQRLLRLLENSSGDANWNLRGAAISSLGLLGVKKSAGRLLALLTDDKVPALIRQAIPAALLRTATARQIVDMADQVDIATSPRETVLGYLAVLGMFGPMMPPAIKEQAYTRLQKWWSQLQPKGELAEMLLATMGSLRYEATASLFVEVLRASTVQRQRLFAIEALEELQLNESEDAILQVASEDPDLRLRLRAILALREFHSESSTRFLVDLLDEASRATSLAPSAARSPKPAMARTLVLALCAFEALQKRADQGSGRAASAVRTYATLQPVLEQLQPMVTSLLRDVDAEPGR